MRTPFVIQMESAPSADIQKSVKKTSRLVKTLFQNTHLHDHIALSAFGRSVSRISLLLPMLIPFLG